MTGCSPGSIGAHVASALAGQAGMRVVLAGPSPARLAAAAAEVRRACPEARCYPMALDLSSLTSVRQFARRFDDDFPMLTGPLALVVHAARPLWPGASGGGGGGSSVTEDGFEATAAVNHLGPFLLTALQQCYYRF